MSFDWPDHGAVTYRLWRLRRLVALSLLCVALGALVGQSLADGGRTEVVGVMLFAWLVVTLHIIVFPNATNESVGLAFCLPVVVLAAAPVAARAEVAFGLGEDVAGLLTSFVMMVGLAICVGSVVWLGAALSRMGPFLGWRIRASGHVGCSPLIAKQQFALVPQSRRGRILTGEANAKGVFDVAVASAQENDPRLPDLPLVARLDAKVLSSDDNHHEVELFLQNGRVTRTRQEFRATDGGCEVTVTDLPGDFTLGMHLRFWLLDMAQDNLTEVFDVIEGRPERAIGLAHGQSMSRILGRLARNGWRGAGQER